MVVSTEVIARAVARRAPLASRPDLTAYRLVHGAADRLPGLAVDRYGGVLVLHLGQTDVEPARCVEPLLAGVARVGMAPRAIYVKRHPPQANKLRAGTVRALAPPDPVWGQRVAQEVILEEGARFLIRPGDGLSVGLFLDMREVRGWVREVAGVRSVLNLFAYTCGFGVSAALGGAARVLNLDASKRYLAWGRENYALNGLAADQRDFVYGDAFDWLGRFARRGERFDLVILDPPSFSTQRGGKRGGRWVAERDYSALAQAAARCVAPAGTLLAATNHAGISAARFRELLAAGVVAAGRDARPLRQWHEPEMDFPVARGDRPYLKVQALALA